MKRGAQQEWPRRLLHSLGMALLLASAVRAMPGVGQAPYADSTALPIVFMHGFLASGDTWATQVQRFHAMGYPADRLFIFDWNSLQAGETQALLERFIDSVLQVSGSGQLFLVGHSAGGGLGYAYLRDSLHASRVRGYVHIGSGAAPGPAGPGGVVPTLNLYSTADKVVAATDIPGAVNKVWTDMDHYEVATSERTFEELVRFFTGEMPPEEGIVPQALPLISGRCLLLGENRPIAGAELRWYRADARGAPRGEPIYRTLIGEEGNWGPVAVEPGVHYLATLQGDEPDFRPVTYYFEPFERDNPLVYLRGFPSPSSMAGRMLQGLPRDEERAVIAIFSGSRAVVHGRDSLYLDEVCLSTEVLSAPGATAIAFFCYDQEGDGVGQGEPVAAFRFFPFLQGADIPLPANPPQSHQLTLNGRTLTVQGRPSGSEGVVIAVFQ